LNPDAPVETSGLRSGTVVLFGWTNVGKSTLLNRLVGQKLAAVADVSQTTRRRMRGVRNVPGRGQIVFVDTPGLHRPKYKMNRDMVRMVHHALRDVDLAVPIVDAARGLGRGDRHALELLLEAERSVELVVLNKVDLVKPKSKLLPMMRTLVEEWGAEEAFPVSALTGDGVDALTLRLLELLPEGPPLFAESYLTDQTERDLAAEWIREKLLHSTYQELPHATAVMIEDWLEREDGLVEIRAVILVERDSQKPIVIGKSGERLKEVGSLARQELEALLERKVYLELHVKAAHAWRNDARVLRRLGMR
jgi:GTP-binding protein Era